MLHVLLSSSFSFMITFFAIPAVMKIAVEKKLFDIPDARKLHKRPIASLGGVGIFIGFVLSSLLFISNKQAPEFQYFFASAFVVFFLGLKDDILIITAYKKFIGQVIAAGILIHLAGVRIDSMHGLFGFTRLPVIASYILSYVTIILIINAFNLIDGVDGLAGSLGLLTMAIFGAYFYMVGMAAYAVVAFAMAGALLAFLIFNHHPAKIFMGDSGSLLLGLTNSVLVIKFINVADSKWTSIPIESAVVIGIAILMVPLMDTLRVFGLRIARGRSPFSPDRNHIHHILLDSGLRHHQVTLCCLLLNIFFITLAFCSRTLGPTYVLFCMVAISLSIMAALIHLKNRRLAAQAGKNLQAEALPAIKPYSKVVSINTEQAVGVPE